MNEVVVFLDRATISATCRPPDFAHEWHEHEETSPGEVLPRLRDATIAVANKVRLEAEVLRQLPKLRLVQVMATGVDNIDVAYCEAHNITVSNVENYAINSVPEHVFMLILALKRNLLLYHRSVQAGEWARSPQFCLRAHPIGDLHQQTLGIIGYGALGKAVGRVAEVFGMEVLISEHKNAKDIRPGRTAFDEVLKNSDVITLHAPLREQTQGLLSTAEFRLMKPEAILINSARGGLIDEAALAEALKSSELGGVGLDVLSTEPPSARHPLLDLNLPNLIITPHIAWASTQAEQTLADRAIENMEAFVRTHPRVAP